MWSSVHDTEIESQIRHWWRSCIWWQSLDSNACQWAVILGLYLLSSDQLSERRLPCRLGLLQSLNERKSNLTNVLCIKICSSLSESIHKSVNTSQWVGQLCHLGQFACSWWKRIWNAKTAGGENVLWWASPDGFWLPCTLESHPTGMHLREGSPCRSHGSAPRGAMPVANSWGTPSAAGGHLLGRMVWRRCHWEPVLPTGFAGETKPQLKSCFALIFAVLS